MEGYIEIESFVCEKSELLQGLHKVCELKSLVQILKDEDLNLELGPTVERIKKLCLAMNVASTNFS